jgi:predicted HTH transcriptional regulator
VKHRQTSFIDPAARELARREHPETSHKAARKVASKLPKLHAEVLEYVRQNPNRTCSELADIAGARDPRRVGRRLPELEAKGMLKRGPARRCTITNRDAATWSVA